MIISKEHAKWSAKPLINARTDLEHPCQALADFLTIKEKFNDFRNVLVTFIGNGNNFAHSLILYGALLRVEVRIACPPKGFLLNPLVIKKAHEIYINDVLLNIIDDQHAAVNVAKVLCTDVWSSMTEKA